VVDKQSNLLTKLNWYPPFSIYFIKGDTGKKQQLWRLTCIKKVVKGISHSERCLNNSRLFLIVTVSVTVIESSVGWLEAV
jgi:hypothetical protein